MNYSHVIDWLNENEHRAYPLRSGCAEELQDVLLDAQIIVRSGEVTASSFVLNSIVTDVSDAVVYVGTGTSTQSFQVTDYNVASNYPLYVRNANGSLLVLGKGLATFTQGSTFDYDQICFEPSVCFDLSGQWNGVSALTYTEHDQSQQSFTGNVRFAEGYQFNIYMEGRNLHMGADRNYGLPVSCERFFTEALYGEECDKVIGYINSIGPNVNPGVIQFNGGPHVVIYDDPENHRLFIGLNFNDRGDICQPVLPNPLTL